MKVAKTEPDPFSAIFGTGYVRFESSTGIQGLGKDNKERIELLAVHASKAGSGQFRNFIQQCKLEYQTICIWEVRNPMLEQVLIRYGFREWSERQKYADDTWETVKGYRWDK